MHSAKRSLPAPGKRIVVVEEEEDLNLNSVVRERGLEPPPLTGPDPKSGASAISPLARRSGHNLHASWQFATEIIFANLNSIAQGNVAWQAAEEYP